MSFQTRVMCDQCGYQIAGEHAELRKFGRAISDASIGPAQLGETEHYHVTTCLPNILENLSLPCRDRSLITIQWKESTK